MGGRTIYSALSPKRIPFQTGTDRWPYLRKVPRKRWISCTHPMWLWGHSLFKISSPGPLFYGTKWLLWHPHKQSSTFHLKCRIDKGLIKRGSTIDHWRSQCKGCIIVAHPLCMHAFIHSFILSIILKTHNSYERHGKESDQRWFKKTDYNLWCYRFNYTLDLNILQIPYFIYFSECHLPTLQLYSKAH
jgi:hypothetical protein